MKLLLILISTLLLAQESVHNFKAVNFYGNTLENVQLIVNSDKRTFTVYYQGKPLNHKLRIVSCSRPEGFCLVRSKTDEGWNKGK